MIDEIYYVGVMCIEYIQELYSGSDALIVWLNNLADPHYAFVYVFPLVALLDSVFAAQYLLVMAGGEWLNVILKWLFAEHRPYWWVQETDYYGSGARPELLQTAQTCETGPGSPSGHLMSVSSHVVLLSLWMSHVVADRKLRVPSWLGWLGLQALIAVVPLVGFARMAVATHFLHQVLFGALCGFFLTPVLTIYGSDAYIWPRSPVSNNRRLWHLAAAVGSMLVALAVYWGIRASGGDPQWSVKLAFKWCLDPHSIQVSTTPLFALVESCGSLTAWALFVTPTVSLYRHNSKNRSLLIAVMCGAATHYLLSLWQHAIPTESAVWFYVHHFVYSIVRGLVYLRVIPVLAMLPYIVSSGRKSC